MPTTYAQWGATVTSSGLSLWVGNPLPEAPDEYNDATDKVRHKFRLRWHAYAPATGISTEAKLCSTGALNLNHTMAPLATTWSSTWAAAQEQIGHPEGYPQEIEDFDSSIAPQHYPGEVYAEAASTSGIIYGINFGVVNDDAYGSDPEWDYTPRSGQTLYDDYYPACSWLISDELICGLNKLVESARWRIAAPVMGGR